ncbi:MAG: hypothetical protein ACKPE1_26730, partial [Dolichospermum sp.]
FQHPAARIWLGSVDIQTCPNEPESILRLICFQVFHLTRWLCKFSRKFDGFKENLDQWVTFATKIIDARQEQFKDNRKGEGLNEIFLIQDEVNVVYGEGKGL